VLEFFLTAGAP